MQTIHDTYTLLNGVRIPAIGLGSYGIPNDANGVALIKTAIHGGYRHIDTAAVYRNEECVGTAVRECGLPRGELFVTSKLDNPDHGYERTMAAFAQTMTRLGLDYLDLYLIHWPNPVAFRDRWQEANAGSWKAFEELYRAGKIRSIGLSNFHRRHIEPLLTTATVAPMVNQIRLCPGDTQDDVVAYSRSQHMILTAYSPLGSGGIFAVPQMRALSEKYGKSIAQIAIRWSIQRGYLPIPKSADPGRMMENLNVFDFALDPQDMALLTGMTGAAGLATDPDTTNF